MFLIHAVSGPSVQGGGPRLLRLEEIQPGPAMVVKQEGSAFSLLAEVPVAVSEACRIFDLRLPVGFAAIFRSYALAGEVNCRIPEESRGYLEATSLFAGPQPPLISRTLGSDLQAPLNGQTTWRPFALPFVIQQMEAAPVKMELRLVLPAGGSVELRNLQLVDGWGTHPRAWFSMEANGRFGAALGTLIGLWGTLLGIARGIWRERSARAVLVTSILWVGGGALCLGGLGWACLAEQPWWIRQQLALCGVLLMVLGAGFYGWSQPWPLLEHAAAGRETR
jgi:hypothetical protein